MIKEFNNGNFIKKEAKYPKDKNTNRILLEGNITPKWDKDEDLLIENYDLPF